MKLYWKPTKKLRGSGVTFGGGEPFAQPGFLLAALTAFVLYRLFIYLRDFEILLNAH